MWTLVTVRLHFNFQIATCRILELLHKIVFFLPIVFRVDTARRSLRYSKNL